MLGATLALVSAALFGLNNATVRRGVLRSTVLQGMAITVPLGLPVFAAVALAMGGFPAMARWHLAGWLWMALAGVVHFVIGRYGNYRATQALGATLSTPIQQISIVVSLALALVFLDETLTVLKLGGILLVMAGPLLSMRRGNAGKASPDGFRPDWVPGTLWGLVAALGYGTSPLFVVYGLGGGGYADSVAGVLVSYLAASVVVVAMVLAVGGWGYVANMDRGSAGWYGVSALFVALSQLFRYLALAVAPVSVVMPIQRLSVVFRVVFNAAINRRHEVLDASAIIAILVSLVGAAALVVNSAWLAAALGLPGGLGDWLARPLF